MPCLCKNVKSSLKALVCDILEFCSVLLDVSLLPLLFYSYLVSYCGVVTAGPVKRKKQPYLESSIKATRPKTSKSQLRPSFSLYPFQPGFLQRDCY